jgi:hypothetical protein
MEFQVTELTALIGATSTVALSAVAFWKMARSSQDAMHRMETAAEGTRVMIREMSRQIESLFVRLGVMDARAHDLETRLSRMEGRADVQ